jgi:CheY-like chemotaxis protein
VTSATHKILVIDDDPALRRVLTMVFETNGLSVVIGSREGTAPG